MSIAEKKIAIIGGGFTGCIIAHYLNKKGYQVEIFERKDKLGGVARDYVKNGKAYFNGPQYLDGDRSFWIEDLIKEEIFSGTLDKYNLLWGSYTDIFGEEKLSDNFAHPITNSRFINNSQNITNFSTMEDRLSYYPSKLKAALTNWCNKYENDLKKLHHECSHPMGVSRLHFENDDDTVSELKKKSKIADDLLGIPDLNYKKRNFFLPANGYNNFFDRYQKYLIQQKVKINLKSTTIIKKEKENFIFFSDGKRIKADHFVWACNPVPLVKIFDLGILDSPIAKVEKIFCDLDFSKGIVKNRYIQVFSKKSDIARIFVYHMNKRNQICLELFYSKNRKNLKEEIEFAKKILRKFNFNVNFIEPINTEKEIRHIFFSLDDYKKILNFEKISENTNLICGGWHIFAREKRIDYIKDKLNRKLK